MREGLDPVLHEKIARIHSIDEFESVDRNPSLTDLMILRKQYGAAAKSLDADERRLASIAIEKLDDFVEAGDSATAGVLKEGRQIWARLRKSEVIEKAIERAADAQSGLESGLRNEFRGLHRAIINGRKDMRGFSADEKAAIRAVCARHGDHEHPSPARRARRRYRHVSAILECRARRRAWVRYGNGSRRPADRRTHWRGACDGRRQSRRSGSAAHDATPGRYGASDRSPGRDADASGARRTDGGDDAMSIPTDSDEFMAALAAVVRAAMVQASAAECSGKAFALEIDAMAQDFLSDGFAMMESLQAGGDMAAEALGWPDAATLSAFLATGTRAGETIH